MIYRKQKIIHIVLALSIVLISILAASCLIDVPYRISTYSEVFPKEKWMITRGNGGQIISTVFNYELGHTMQYDIAQFERGEFISADFIQYIMDRHELLRGDTVVFLQSSNVRDQIIATEGELEIAVADLNSKNSNQKEALIKEAENRLKYNEKKIDEQKIIYERTKILFEKGYCSKQEYELQKWNLDLLEIESKIYEAQVENLNTGVKPEEIKLLESQINSIEKRLKFYKDRESQLFLVSPIYGRVISSFSPDTLLNVINYSQVVLHTPIKICDIPEIKEIQKIPVYFIDSGIECHGKILSIDNEVKVVNGQQVIFISVLFDNSAGQFLPGMIVQNSLRLKNTSLLKNISRAIVN